MALAIEFDDAEDEVVINGIRYAQEVFRTLGIARPGQAFQIVKRDPDGTLTITELTVDGIG